MQTPSADKILSAREALAAADPALAVADAAVAPFAWRSTAGGVAGLSQMIVSQQVSTAAAAAIWGRLVTGLGGAATPEAIMAAEEGQLRSYGLSSQKARYVRAIAEAHLGGVANFDHLPDSDDEAMAALMTIKGVGRWTAELYLLFSEGRLDAFPAGDLALQEGLRLAEGGEARLNEKGLYARAEAWRPYRGVAAHLLWAYYSLIKRGGGTPPPPAEPQA